MAEREEPTTPVAGGAAKPHLESVAYDSSAVRLAKEILERQNRYAASLKNTQPDREALRAFLTNQDNIQRIVQSPEFASSIQNIKEAADKFVPLIYPKLEAYAKAMDTIGRNLAQVIVPYEGTIRELAVWQTHLNERLRALDRAWVLPDHIQQALVGFGRLSRLSEGAQSADPYARKLSDLIEEELGPAIDLSEADVDARDALAVDAGLNPDLIAFRSENYTSVVISAGFDLYVPRPVIPLAGGGNTGIFDPNHGYLLSQTEQRLRRLIEERLSALLGSRWIKQRVAEDVRKRWAERQEEDRSLGRDVYNLIQYSDFMDLADIICQRSNWREVFSEVFGNQEDFRTSLRRLHPIRKCIAHSRPLSRFDVLTLISETTRILKTLGVDTIGSVRE